MPPLLELKGITKRFGGVQALSRGDFSLEKGEIHFLVGANGCGKSTLSKIIVCALERDSGDILYNSNAVNFSGPGDARNAGIGVVYQELSLVPDLTVLENMTLGNEPHTRLGFVDVKEQEKQCKEALDQFKSVVSDTLKPDVLVSRLSSDEKQIVEILKVFIRNPEVIILDEATSSLHASQVEVLFSIIKELKSQGRSIIMISHKMQELFEIGDRATIIRNGKTVATVVLSDSSHEEIVTNMVGEQYYSTEKIAKSFIGDKLLEVDKLNSGILKDVSFSLHKGEILGLSGLQGQGQSELLLTLFGNHPDAMGAVSMNGTELTLKSPGHSVKDGFAYISGDRKKYGVFLIRSILENTALAFLGKIGLRIFRRNRIKSEVLPTLERLSLVYSNMESPISELSGGNQQKVIIGRWLMTKPDVILMDDPTKGVDIQTKEELYRLMKELCESGVSIIWNSSEDQEILQNADRVLVFNGGKIVDELIEDRLSEYELYKAAMA